MGKLTQEKAMKEKPSSLGAGGEGTRRQRGRTAAEVLSSTGCVTHVTCADSLNTHPAWAMWLCHHPTALSSVLHASILCLVICGDICSCHKDRGEATHHTPTPHSQWHLAWLPRIFPDILKQEKILSTDTNSILFVKRNPFHHHFCTLLLLECNCRWTEEGFTLVWKWALLPTWDNHTLVVMWLSLSSHQWETPATLWIQQ